MTDAQECMAVPLRSHGPAAPPLSGPGLPETALGARANLEQLCTTVLLIFKAAVLLILQHASVVDGLAPWTQPNITKHLECSIGRQSRLGVELSS